MAWFTFSDASNEVFVFRLTDGDAVAHARELLAGTDSSDPLIGGTVVKTSAPCNIGWSFHLAPGSVFFFEVSTEVGDSTMRYIEDHLAEVGGAFLPGSVWTGWSSVLLEELRPKGGGAGSDILAGSASSDILFGRAGSDLLVGAGGDDHLVAGEGADKLLAGRGNDKLSGGSGCDLLCGGRGNDVLVGGNGNDELRGGEGRDTFLFAPGSDIDLIAGFTDINGNRDDVIDLRAYGFASKAGIGIAASGKDLVLDFGGGNTLTIRDYLCDHSLNQIGNDLLI